MKNLVFFSALVVYHTHFYTQNHTQGIFRKFSRLGLLALSACNCLILLYFPIVPRAGLEPAQTQCLQDFKSCVSTNSTTRAKRTTCNTEEYIQKLLIGRHTCIMADERAKDGSRTRDLNLGKVALYQLSYFRII